MTIRDTDNFQQTRTADCQTLAVLYGIMSTPRGAEYVQKMIKSHNPDGSYVVKFAGYEKDIVVVPKDIADKELIKSANPELKVIQAAYLKVHASENSVMNPFELFMGKGKEVYGFNLRAVFNDDVRTTAFIRKLLPQALEKGAVITGQTDENPHKEIIDLQGRKVKLMSNHVYSLCLRNDNNVEVTDTYDTSKKIVIRPEDASYEFVHIFASAPPGKSLSVPSYFKPVMEKSKDFAHSCLKHQASGGAYDIGMKAAENPEVLKKMIAAREELNLALKTSADNIKQDGSSKDDKIAANKSIDPILLSKANLSLNKGTQARIINQ